MGVVSFIVINAVVIFDSIYIIFGGIYITIICTIIVVFVRVNVIITFFFTLNVTTRSSDRLKRIVFTVEVVVGAVVVVIITDFAVAQNVTGARVICIFCIFDVVKCVRFNAYSGSVLLRSFCLFVVFAFAFFICIFGFKFNPIFRL